MRLERPGSAEITSRRRQALPLALGRGSLGGESEPGRQRAREQPDIDWFSYIADFSERNELLFMVPFWTWTFFHYAGSDETTVGAYALAVEAAAQAGTRTKLHDAYGALLE